MLGRMKIRFNFHSEIPIFNLDPIFQFFNSNFFNFFQRKADDYLR